MKVRITIRGRTYTVRSDEDDVDLQEVARYVDARMGEIAGRTSAGFDEYTVAMLACLNIASDFERYRRRVDSELEGLERDLAAAEVVLRAAMPQDGTDASTNGVGTDGAEPADAASPAEAAEA